ncbi:hypothetical protein GDO78_002315 [Eleutherodactylus coqui]|uniref:Uncharacterized protein n=1 Tax=Eleutherodactylus coqui TaxID=57060 RepID=A0A8J6K278_ELECQ|nr:hypothetical protein GDO78_002315 [Eleutherodactylus coqui]
MNVRHTNDEQVEGSQWFLAPAGKMVPNRVCSLQYTLHISLCYGAVVHGEGHRSWRPASSHTSCPSGIMLCHWFLGLFSVGGSSQLFFSRATFWFFLSNLISP